MDDFERRRELRRQKREEIRLEAERIAYQRNDDDEEEAARERRRRARQERLRQKQEEESLGQVTDQVEVHAQNRYFVFHKSSSRTLADSVTCESPV
ncbi:Caldesmon [Myotis davidii]|uniref:Caldesmon n=1 Tax=Myotis davidii TaxID=225400 RepID=L5MCV5_MYODS|nr:Caldesmon [Myotis davidii]